MISIPHPNGDIVVNLLTPNDWVALSEARWAQTRVQLTADLDASGVSPDIRLTTLRAHSATRGSVMDALLHISTISGASEALRIALTRAGRGDKADECMAHLGVESAVRVALTLVGFHPEKEDEPNPTLAASATTS